MHDIGHLLHDLPDDIPDRGQDDHHEASGSRFLKEHFPEAVFEPVRLHVAAKRFLCSTEFSYLEKLSQPSLTSLKLQGGLMSDEECEAFRANPYSESAVRLRRWDDEANVSGLKTGGFENFLGYLQEAVRQ